MRNKKEKSTLLTTSLRVVCQRTGMMSTPQPDLPSAMRVAEKEGFRCIDGKWYYVAPKDRT
jgi:hypothetical protein